MHNIFSFSLKHVCKPVIGESYKVEIIKKARCLKYVIQKERQK